MLDGFFQMQIKISTSLLLVVSDSVSILLVYICQFCNSRSIKRQCSSEEKEKKKHCSCKLPMAPNLWNLFPTTFDTASHPLTYACKLVVFQWRGKRNPNNNGKMKNWKILVQTKRKNKGETNNLIEQFNGRKEREWEEKHAT